MILPFELSKDHKRKTLYNWINVYKLKETEERIDEIYNQYIQATHCDLCNKTFTKTIDRVMDHDHKSGAFRNILCNKCNLRKADINLQPNNVSGFSGICKEIRKDSKLGYRWKFKAVVDGKHKVIKTSSDLEWLKTYALDWKLNNNYHT
jgi:hypothetical protein